MTVKDKLFLLAVFYVGPWERLERVVLGVRKKGGLRWEVGSGDTPAGRLADWLDRRNLAWRRRHAERGTDPLWLWRR